MSASTNITTDSFSIGNFSVFCNVFLKKSAYFKMYVFRYACNKEISVM